MFINLSNHASECWPQEQREAAGQWGEVVDYPFPAVPADMDGTQVSEMAEKIVDEIMAMAPHIVMCQGEFTLSYAIIRALRARGVTVVAACSERRVKETLVDGKYEKRAGFEFVRFREYE